MLTKTVIAIDCTTNKKAAERYQAKAKMDQIVYYKAVLGICSYYYISIFY